MSVRPPDGPRTVIYTTECPVPTCPYVAITEGDGAEIRGGRKVAAHLNDNHDPSEIP